MKNWRALLLIYRELDVKLARVRFRHTLTRQEIGDALESFRGFPKLVDELTSGTGSVSSEIAEIKKPLTSLSRRQKNEWWPSPADTRREIDSFAPPGRFDSIFVFWPQHDFGRDTSVPSHAWGLGMAASDWSNGATYAAIANAPSANWKNEARGEVWLHEWLHGVCHHFGQLGHIMPERDADGAEMHGYVRSPTRGWTEYYRDLMNADVLEDGKRLGIPSDWHSKAALAGQPNYSKRI